MNLGSRATTADGHMEHIRFYSAEIADRPSTVIGFSDGITAVADDETMRSYLADELYDVQPLSDYATAGVVGSLSLRHIAIHPPLTDAIVAELVPILLTGQGTRNVPQGIMVVDNRRGEIPADRSRVSGPILGSMF